MISADSNQGLFHSFVAAAKVRSALVAPCVWQGLEALPKYLKLYGRPNVVSNRLFVLLDEGIRREDGHAAQGKIW